MTQSPWVRLQVAVFVSPVTEKLNDPGEVATPAVPIATIGAVSIGPPKNVTVTKPPAMSEPSASESIEMA